MVEKRGSIRPALYLVLLLSDSASLGGLPGAAAIDARVRAALAATRANGMAIAVIDDGRVAYVQAYGARHAKGDPLQTDTVMYGALRWYAATACRWPRVPNWVRLCRCGACSASGSPHRRSDR